MRRAQVGRYGRRCADCRRGVRNKCLRVGLSPRKFAHRWAQEIVAVGDTPRCVRNGKDIGVRQSRNSLQTMTKSRNRTITPGYRNSQQSVLGDIIAPPYGSGVARHHAELGGSAGSPNRWGNRLSIALRNRNQHRRLSDRPRARARRKRNCLERVSPSLEWAATRPQMLRVSL
jgi:hypothetical protein